MNYGTIKFNFDFFDMDQLDGVFNIARDMLNFQFDDDFNVVLVDSNVNYQFKDVSSLDCDEVEIIADSFFDFTFDEICNVFLYKFLVLKNSEKFTLLAIISSSIFDYTSLNDFYELFNNSNSVPLKNDLSLHYENVKNYLASQDFNTDSLYWRNFILNASDYIKFYNLKTNNYKSQKIDVDEKSVMDFVESQNCSTFNFYASVFALYLSRIDRQEGCLLNTNIQLSSDDSNVFNKTILKVDFNNGGSFADYLHQFNAAYDEAADHTKVSIENFIDENLSYYSVYDFSDLNENISIYNGDDSALTLNIYDGYLELVYNSDLFSDVYIEHMAENIGSLIDNVLNSPNQIINEINILSGDEKDLISDFCKGKTVDVDKDKIFAESFREHAKANPDAVAVDDGVNQITYGELEKSSNSLANDLYVNHGIGSGSRVALMLPRNYHFAEFILALSKIGAAYVPIDLLFPANRIGHMLYIAGVNNLITTESIAQNLDLNVNIIYIEDLKYDNDVEVEILSELDDLFAILFTSGTTGLPKGVMFYYKQFPWGGAAFEKMFNFSPGDVIGSYFSFSFVASFVICISMYLGGCVRIFNENEQKNSLLLIKALKETPMNSLILPPAVGIPIFENEDLQLDYLVLAGAKLNELNKKDRHTKLVNFYGTTEIIFAVSKIYEVNDIEDNRVPIGRPVSNTWAYILDENGNQMPIGVPGEICISGGMICDGYFNNAETTSESFVDNPFCDNEINEKMYRTGDIGFYNFDGDIEIIGREDNQLSVRGFRIESNEILSVMKSFEEISDIYLDVDYDNLIAYYTTGGDLDIEVVKEALNNEVPYYMVPSLFIELDEIPLNINGKIDRSSLKKSMADDNVEIADDVLRCVVDGFKEVLNLDSVLIDDDFVALGGNSLSAMKLQLLLKERLDVYLSSNELMDVSTPQEIANYIKYNLNVHSVIDEDKYSFDEHCPLSESQLNIYLDESVNDMGTAYSNSFKIEFNDSYSVGEIKDALIKLFDVFPVLKARVLNDDGELSFVFDGEPEITEGTVNDMDSFVRPFDFDKYLSRFLIVEDETSVVLCADFHHLIFDGTSLKILLDKFSSILNNENVDFVDKGVLRQIAFEEIIDSSYMDDAKEFYDEMLADRDEVYDLLPSVDGDDGESVLIDTFDMDMDYLTSFLQSNSITYNQFFTGVFAYALSRFSGSEKVLFNIIEDGRGHIDLSESVGMFVKTLPVLMDCKNQDIGSFLEYSSSLVNSVMRYDLYPFRVLAREYDLNSNVLFQYSHDLFSDVVNKDDLNYVVDELDHDRNSDLSFFILNNGVNRLTIRVLYSSAYSKSFIEHFVDSYKLILNEVIGVDELKDIDYISDVDIGFLDAFNQTEHDLIYDDVLDAFNDNLLKNPKSKLVSCNDVSYSYAEGAYIADAIGKKLSGFGVNAQDCVGFLVPRSELYMFSVLGIMFIGAVYVPLDDTLPDERIEFILKDTDSRVIIASDETYSRAEKLSENIPILNISDILKGDIESLSHLPVVYGDVASILYTSGSTGVPKGVKITRKSILNVANYYCDIYGLNESDVYGLYASIGFDAGVMSIFKAIFAGACLSVVPEEIRYDMNLLNDYFIEQNVTHTIITTPVGKLFMQTVDGTSLDYLFVGGEKLGDFQSPSGYQLVDEYGPTEGNNFISSINNSDKMDSSSIGKLNYNSKAYILDNDGRRVPCGAVGELYLAGYQIADGYLNREEETKKAFVNNPFDDSTDYGVLYRTGDMVRVLPDGSLAIIGRRDGQVKVRGNRVELSEVESVIRELSYISDVTVQTVDNHGNNDLVAYVVVSHEVEDIEYSVCEHVMEHKPDYMVPAFVIELDDIPLTVNGKVNKKELPGVDLDSLHAEYVAPSNETEKAVVDAFDKVFDGKIGIYDDFVRLGGDSLTGIKVLSSLENHNITLADVLSLRTPYAIANKIVKNRLEFDLDIYSVESGCPLNESQLNVYLDILANDKVDSYLIPSYTAISKVYGVGEIVDALDEMLDVHPILGMCVSDEFDVPYLVKGSKPEVLVESDVSDDYIVEFLQRPFNLKDSLCRFLIVERDDKYDLIGNFHHIVFDAFSQDIFKKDLHSILDGELVAVDDAFLKVSAFAQQMPETDEFSEAKVFYESMLEDSDEAGALLDNVLSDGPNIEEIDLNVDLDLLESFLDSHGVSHNVFFTSVFSYTLSRFVGNDKVLFSIAENGRERFGKFNTIGMYVNTLPILADCSNRDVSSFMDYMSDLVYGVMKYNYYPFRLLANKFNFNLNIIFQFLPDWILDYEYYGKHDIEVVTAENRILYGSEDLISDFSVQVNQSYEGYNLRVTYSDKYSGDFVNHFMDSYRLILHEILNRDCLGDINYITTDDIEVLDGYNQTEHDLVYNDILDAFNDNLSKYPKKNLVSYKDNVYSYEESAFLANEISNNLKAMGVGKGDNVAFLVSRSELYMFSVLGILSIGAVYVPLDDNLPDERVKFMLKDTESKVLIVNDATYGRALDVGKDCIILNISDIVDGDISSLTRLDSSYSDLACILYTSGSTGLPKGVKITRKSIVNFIDFHVHDLEILSDDVYGLFASIGFDVAMAAMFSVIYSGACLDIIPEDIRLNIRELNEHFIEYGITHTYITTQIAKLFVREIEKTSLKVLVAGGEKLGELDEIRNYKIVDAYGPTEACVYVISAATSDKIDYSSVGYVQTNTKAYVLDKEFRRVPIGAVGELYLSGCQLADGYLNREEETAEAFMNNPFEDDEEYGGLYCTGDVARILPDGTYGIVGRRDSQVKIRGNRVELSEIESVIRELDNVEDVTVQTINYNNNNELVAYVVASKDINEDNFRDLVCDYVGEHKPDYMVPSFVVKLDNIPLNVNGKVDKSALPNVDLSGLHAEYVAPTNETEKHIVDAFEHVFNQKGIGLNDDFVRLGGDSITAIRVISLLDKNDISCSVRHILNYKTPYLIAQNVEKITKISYDASEGEVDLLPIQSYFFDQNRRNDFSQKYILKSKVDLDLDILQKAFDELTNIHDMLRATFRYDENEVIQEILPLDSRVCEINEYNVDNLDDDFINIIKEFTESLDIGEELVKVGLVRHGDECYLIFVIHHLIIDGISWSVLFDDLTYLYNQLENNRETNILRPYPYKSWVEDVKSLAENISDEERQHWINVNGLLDDSIIIGESKGFAFNVDVLFDVDNLLMLSEEEYLALSIARAYKKTFGEDIIFNRESYGRDESLADVRRTIGWFTSQFPVVVGVNNEYDAISLMDDVYSIKTAFKSVDYLGLNYGSLVYTSRELEYKHCPVTFNFLSSEFSFKNELFESFNQQIYSSDKMGLFDLDFETFGITFDVVHQDNSYNIIGKYADNTYIGDGYEAFIENIKFELDFIGSFDFDGNKIVCCLSESQLGVYLDEKVHEKGSAYSNPKRFECGSSYSIDEIEDAVHSLISRHPILRGRVLDTDNLPLLVCDSYPTIEIRDSVGYSDLDKAFDLEKSLARFLIEDNEDGKSIYYSVHHIISDATSVTIINNELEQALLGELDDSVDLGFVYASRDSFESQYDYKYKSAQKFFRDEFADIDDVQYLLKDVDGSRGSVSLPIRGIRDDVELFTQNHGITVSNLLNAVFAYTYSRFTGSDKVYYNFTEHGRHENYLQNAFGMFVRTVPFIANCENQSVGGFVSNISDSIFKSMTNSIYPFRLVAKEFDLSNDVIFEYNYDLNEFEIGNDIVVRDYAESVSEFLCVVNDLEDGFLVSVSHLDKYTQYTAVQFVKTFKEILVQFLEKENLSDIDYISNEDIKLLDSYNRTEHPLVYDDILDAFNENLSKYPKNNLVSYKDNVYSYEEGAFLANEISNNLKAMGVGKGDNVAFLVSRSELYMFSVLGILSIGAVYVPLDDNHPDDRIKFMLQDTDAKVIIVCDETYGRAESLAEDVEILNISNIVSGDAGTISNLPVVYGNLACILYTSGTTGLPKGVKITRKSVINVAESYIGTYDLDNEDVCGLFTAIGFDVTNFVITTVMCAGACLSVVPEEIRLNMAELNKYFIKQNVSHAFITTQVGKLFMQSADNTSLDVLYVIGEKLGEVESPKDYLLIDAYGPTEAFAYVSSIDNDSKLEASSVGTLNYNTRAYILDDEKRRVPCGAIGELYLAGFQVADGYLNRPEVNVKSFIDNPFDDDEGYDTLYATGDVVRLLSDGSIGIIGRRDGQVKIRGNRVELTEIESVIREIDYVDDVTVQTVKHDTNNEVVAYVVVNNDLDGNGLKDSVCDYVYERKPDYMVPSFVIRMDEIPLNVNGKVDKRALPDVDRSSLHGEYVAPRDENEKVIVEAFEKALNIENVGIYDDFISLGGDSLTAIRLLSYIESDDISMADIFAFRTPEAIAKNMSDLSFDLDLYNLEDGCPLNAAQINVFADVNIYNKSNAYHIPGFIPISKEYGLEHIRDSLDKLLDAHPILGMRLSDEYEANEAGNAGNLVVLKDLINSVKKLGISKLMDIINSYGLRDIGGLYNMLRTTIRLFKGEYPYIVKGDKPPISVESNVDKDTIIDFFSESLDLYNYLSKFMIVESDESYYLFYLIHHIIFDVTSGGVFRHNLQVLLDGGSVALDDTFLKVSAFTHQIKNTDKFVEASEFYDSFLSDVGNAGELMPDTSSKGYNVSYYDLEFDRMAFKSFLNNAGISENVLFTSVFAYTLSQFVDGDKSLFMLIENGRDRFSENFIGMTSNVMPLVVGCNDQSIDSFMEQMSYLVYGASRYSYYPLLLLYQKYDFEVKNMFQFVPNWLADDVGYVESFEGIDVEEITNQVLNSYSDFLAELFVQIYQYGENYRIIISNSNKYSDKMINEFKDTYMSVLSNIIHTDLSSDLSDTLK